jgi:hypothetical protein
MTKNEYQTYKASREWALLREAVRQRAKNICEHCGARPMDDMHHKTYERIGRELLTDLMAVCEPCHEFLSGKSEINPLINQPHRPTNNPERVVAECAAARERSSGSIFVHLLCTNEDCDVDTFSLTYQYAHRLNPRVWDGKAIVHPFACPYCGQPAELASTGRASDPLPAVRRAFIALSRFGWLSL